MISALVVEILIGYVSAYLPFDARTNAEILAQLYGPIGQDPLIAELRRDPRCPLGTGGPS